MTPPWDDPPVPPATGHDLHLIVGFVLGLGIIGDMYEGGAWGISCLATAAVLYLAGALCDYRDQGQNRGPGLDDHPG
jgi:hypothetical protein